MLTTKPVNEIKMSYDDCFFAHDFCQCDVCDTITKKIRNSETDEALCAKCGADANSMPDATIFDVFDFMTELSHMLYIGKGDNSALLMSLALTNYYYNPITKEVKKI